jgi:hypothetical protein
MSINSAQILYLKQYVLLRFVSSFGISFIEPWPMLLKLMIIYIEPSIISGTAAALWSKTNLGPTSHHHVQIRPLPCLCAVPSASGILKCVVEVVFCEGIQHSLRFCLDHLTVSKWRPFSLIFNQGNRENYSGWGTTVILFLLKNSLVERSVRRWVFMTQQPVLLSSNFVTKFSHFFTQSP